MTSNEPEPANRWATEHYGFVDEPSGEDAGAADLAALAAARRAQSRHDWRHSPGRAGLIASVVVSLALVAGVGGAAVASDDGPDGRRHATTQLDRGAGPGDPGHRGGGGGHT